MWLVGMHGAPTCRACGERLRRTNSMCSQADDPSAHDIEYADGRVADYKTRTDDTLRAALDPRDVAFIVNCIPWEREDLRQRVRAALAASATDEGPLPAGHPDTWPGGTLHMHAASATDVALDERALGMAVRKVLDKTTRERFLPYLDLVIREYAALAASATDEPLVGDVLIEQRVDFIAELAPNVPRDTIMRVVIADEERRHRAALAASATEEGTLRAVAEDVDRAWFVVDGDEGRDKVRLRYASDLPRRLNALRAALAASATEEEWTAEDEKRARLREQRRAASVTEHVHSAACHSENCLGRDHD